MATIQNNALTPDASDAARADAYFAANQPAPTASTGDQINSAPLTTAATALGKNLSGQYANVNGTIYNKITGQAFSTPQQFFADSGQNSFAGLTFDTNFAPATPGGAAASTADAANTALNSGQQSAFDNNNGSPLNSDQALNDAKADAQSLIDTATTNIGGLQKQLADSTTGQNDLRVQTQNYYDSLGVASAQDAVAAAQKALGDVQVAQKSNKLNLENQLTGTGATEGFAGNVDSREQQVLSIKELSASIQLQVAQQSLSNKIDVFKTFTQQADEQQKNTIQELSTQLSLNKADLTAGVQLLNQARLEAHGDEVAARQLVTTIATQVPGLFQALTPADQQNLSQGKITPTILATIGTLTTTAQAKLDIAQQNANVNLSRAFGSATGLSQFGGPADGTATLQKTQGDARIQIAQQRLDLARSNAGTGNFDPQAVQQDMANTITNFSLIPPTLKGYFEQKRDSAGNTYVAPRALKKNELAQFQAAYSSYWKANSSTTYQPNQSPTDAYVYDPNQVFAKISGAFAAGKSWLDIRAAAQSDGVPLTVYQTAVKQVLAGATKAAAFTPHGNLH